MMIRTLLISCVLLLLTPALQAAPNLEIVTHSNHLTTHSNDGPQCLYGGTSYSIGAVIEVNQSGIFLQCGYPKTNISPKVLAGTADRKPQHPSWQAFTSSKHSP